MSEKLNRHTSFPLRHAGLLSCYPWKRGGWNDAGGGLRSGVPVLGAWAAGAGGAGAVEDGSSPAVQVLAEAAVNGDESAVTSAVTMPCSNWPAAATSRPG